MSCAVACAMYANAACSKIMRVQDLILVAQKIRVVTRFRGTMGLRGFYRLLFTQRDHAHKVPDHHHFDHAGNMRDG